MHWQRLCVLLPLLLAACGAPDLRDLRVEAAEVAPRSPPAAYLYEPLYDKPLIRLDLSAERDLSIYGRDHSAVVYMIVSLCTRGQVDRTRQVQHFGLYDTRGIRVGSARAPGVAPGPDSRGRYIYQTYLPFDTRPGRLHATRDDDIQLAHDLRRQNDDLCLQVFGSTMSFFPHFSNTVTIPYSLIAAALARAGLPHAAVP